MIDYVGAVRLVSAESLEVMLEIAPSERDPLLKDHSFMSTYPR